MESHITVTKTFETDTAHRLQHHKGKCAFLHGHRYRFEVTLQAAELDEMGMVEDFGIIKARIGAWLDDRFDHACVLEETDPLVQPLVAAGMKLTLLDCAPTAEAFAELVYKQVLVMLEGERVSAARVRCWETPTSYCDYAGGGRMEGLAALAARECTCPETLRATDFEGGVQ